MPHQDGRRPSLDPLLSVLFFAGPALDGLPVCGCDSALLGLRNHALDKAAVRDQAIKQRRCRWSVSRIELGWAADSCFNAFMQVPTPASILRAMDLQGTPSPRMTRIFSADSDVTPGQFRAEYGKT